MVKGMNILSVSMVKLDKPRLTPPAYDIDKIVLFTMPLLFTNNSAGDGKKLIR